MAGARENNLFSLTLPAAADYQTTSKQFYAVDINATGQAVLVSAAGQRVVGVLQNKPLANQAATVQVAGVTKMIASGVIATGATVASDAAGKAKAASALVQATGAASNVIGICLDGSGTANDVITVLLTYGGVVPTTAA
jgi:hypothetical protein